MNANQSIKGATRREFLKTTTQALAGATLTAALARSGYAAETNTIKVALVGCGGRGTGAAANALATKNGPIKLVAMADVFEDRLKRSYETLSKGSAVISTYMHTPAKCRIYKGHNFTADNLTWAFPQPEPNPYILEWEHLIEAIRNDKPYNEAKRGTEASLVTAMGRMAAHTGRIVTWEQMLNHTHEFAVDVDKLTMDSPAPLLAGGDGRYPLPQPGKTVDREY